MLSGPPRKPGVAGGGCWTLTGVPSLWVIPSAPCIGYPSGFQFARLLKAAILSATVWRVGV